MSNKNNLSDRNSDSSFVWGPVNEVDVLFTGSFSPEIWQKYYNYFDIILEAVKENEGK